MLTMLGSRRRCCDGLTRRETLKAGALGLLGGFHLPGLLRAEEARGARAAPGKAKSVIVLYLLGGARHAGHVRPEARRPRRGPRRVQADRHQRPGIQICEHLPLMARWMHRAAIVRSVNHKAGCHNPLPSYTGFEETLADIVSTSDTYPPSMGSVCEYLKDERDPLPAYVYMPCYLGWGQSIRRPGPYAGFLGKRYDPLFTECSPYVDKDAPAERPGHPQVLRGEPRIPDSTLGEGITIDRFHDPRAPCSSRSTTRSAAPRGTRPSARSTGTRRGPSSC